MKKFTQLVYLLSLILFCASCQEDDDITPLGKYEGGVLISNEGNFTDADGSIGFYSNTSESVSLKIFESENGRPFGGLVQSIGIHENYVYLIDNLGSKLEVVDANTFNSINPILDGLSLPRYFVAEGTTGFISTRGATALARKTICPGPAMDWATKTITN